MTTESSRFPVWDIPVRLFHWLLVLLVFAAWLSMEQGEYVIHSWIGFSILALLIFRIIWGLVGSRHSRFTDFMRGPVGILQYLRNPEKAGPGHNPLGGLSVIAMLAVLLFQAISGLFTTDELLFTGPYFSTVSEDTSLWLTSLHQSNFDLILALIALHIAAIVFYRLVKKKRLVKAMITGYSPDVSGKEKVASIWRGLLAAVVALAITASLLILAP